MSYAFATHKLVSRITNMANRPLDGYEIEDILDLVNVINPPPQVAPYVPAPTADINFASGSLYDLMSAIANGRKIDAIKAYRLLTGYGLKESKDAVEAACGNNVRC
jgi:ribosomal protein L7/L12